MAAKRTTGTRDCSRALIEMRASSFDLMVMKSLSEKGHWVESGRAIDDLRERFF